MDDSPENLSIFKLDDDLLENILEKLPAKSFAYASCVSRSWNGICNRVLSLPQLCSALSLNPSLPEAMSEIVSKVLSGPIRPHFAILSICPAFHLDEAHRLLTSEFGSSIPSVTCISAGIIGRDALTDQFAEVNFLRHPEGCGISLTVGYVPGLKVDAVPLGRAEGSCSDKFVRDIEEYSASVSGCTSPEAIIMFADSEVDMKPVLQKMDCVYSKQTYIAGNEGCCVRYQRICNSRVTARCSGRPGLVNGGVALVFVRDKSNLNGFGKIEFHLSIGTGVVPMGSTYKVASAKMRSREFSTWLTARRRGENETLDGNQMLEDVDMEMFGANLYIGVTKRRKCAVGPRNFKVVTSVVYHPVQDADEEYLYTCGLDIKTGDTFRFYAPDPTLALPSCERISREIGQLKDKKIIGGFIFTCCGRGEPFFEKTNVDISPILDNFPFIPISGMFCAGEIGRGPFISAKSDEGLEQDTAVQSLLHVYSSVYLLMSYSPPACKP